jgi:hypothetical protein
LLDNFDAAHYRSCHCYVNNFCKLSEHKNAWLDPMARWSLAAFLIIKVQLLWTEISIPVFFFLRNPQEQLPLFCGYTDGKTFVSFWGYIFLYKGNAPSKYTYEYSELFQPVLPREYSCIPRKHSRAILEHSLGHNHVFLGKPGIIFLRKYFRIIFQRIFRNIPGKVGILCPKLQIFQDIPE